MIFLQLNLKWKVSPLYSGSIFTLIGYLIITLWVLLEANLIFPVSQFLLFDGLVPIPSVIIKFVLILALLCSVALCDTLHFPATYLKLLIAFTVYILFQLVYHSVTNQYPFTYMLFSLNTSYLYFFLFPLFFVFSGVLESDRVLKFVCTVGILLMLLGLCQFILNKPVVPTKGRVYMDPQRALSLFFNAELQDIRGTLVLYEESAHIIRDVNGFVELLQKNRRKITPWSKTVVIINRASSPHKRIHLTLDTHLTPEENIHKLIEEARSGRLEAQMIKRYQRQSERVHALEMIAESAKGVQIGQHLPVLNQLQKAGLGYVKKNLENLLDELALYETKSYRSMVAESISRIIPVQGSLQVLSMNFYGRVRAFSLFDSGSRFGSFLVYLVPVLMTVLLTNQKKTSRWLWGTILLLAMICIYATLTRLVYLQALAMLFTFAILRLDRNMRMILFLPVIYGITSVFCVTALPYLADLLGSGSPLFSPESLFTRLEQWSEYINLWFTDLYTALFGTGLIQNDRFPLTADVLVDNTIIGFGLQNGLLGLALCLALVWSIWRLVLYMTLRNPTPLGVGALCALSTWPIAAVFGMTGSEFVLYLLPMIMAGTTTSLTSFDDKVNKGGGVPASS